MIITLTANPSIDLTLSVPAPLSIGQVHRATSMTHSAAGKGVNVAQVLHGAGATVLALCPAAPEDPFCSLIARTGLPIRTSAMSGAIRLNTTITDPEGQTTKINGPGPQLNSDELHELERTLFDTLDNHPDASWLVLAGSLPPGVAPQWYGDLIERIRQHCPHIAIAVDTSDAPLQQLGKHLPLAAPDLIKPNAEELGQLSGREGRHLEAAAAAGDFEEILAAARHLNAQQVGTVLVSLGAVGAAAITANEAYFAPAPAVAVHSTVGAGDSTLAGFLLSRSSGASLAESLCTAVAYGSAAAALPGTSLPHPEDLPHHLITVQSLP